MSVYHHASAVMIGGHGVLIRGESGSGKSSLADVLIDQARLRGLDAALVGDDRVAFKVERGHLVASGHPQIAGKLERRGAGIFDVPFVSDVIVRLVIDLQSENPERLPSPESRETQIESVSVPRLVLKSPVNYMRVLPIIMASLPQL